MVEKWRRRHGGRLECVSPPARAARQGAKAAPTREGDDGAAVRAGSEGIGSTIVAAVDVPNERPIEGGAREALATIQRVDALDVEAVRVAA